MQESHQQIWRSHNCNFEHWGLRRVVEREGKLAKLWTVRIIACGKVKERENRRGKKSRSRRERKRTILKNQSHGKVSETDFDSGNQGNEDEEQKRMKGNGNTRLIIRLRADSYLAPLS